MAAGPGGERGRRGGGGGGGGGGVGTREQNPTLGWGINICTKTNIIINSTKNEYKIYIIYYIII